MSRWLLNVAQVLEKLDDRAEQAVEEHQQLLEEQQDEQHRMMAMVTGAGASGHPSSERLDADDNEAFETESDPIASILSARGLAALGDDDDDDEEEIEDVDGDGLGEMNSSSELHGEAVTEEKGEREGKNDGHEDGGGGGRGANRAADEGWGEMSFTDATASERHEDEQVLRDDVAGEQQHDTQSSQDGLMLPGAPPEKGETSAGDGDDKSTENEGSAETQRNVLSTEQEDDISHDRDSESDDPQTEPLTVSTAPSTSTNQSSSASSRRPILSTPLVASFTGGTPSAAAAMAANLASTALKSWGGGPAQPSRPSADAAVGGAAADGNVGATEASQQLRQLQEMLGQAQREVRTLCRNVVALNKQLEGAEREVVAQRNELEQAAERMVKDSARHKDERERERANHQNQIQALKLEQNTALQEQKAKYEALLEESRSYLRSLEDQRRQEGGNRDKELADALDREQQALTKLEALEDERMTLLSQISTLQSQQESLGSRLESLSQTAENAFAREREAEVRLDEALSMHARQISQRQAREAELERTVSELGAALVAAEKRTSSKLDSSTGEPSNEHGETPSVALLRVATVESELEALRSQLFDEQQRNHTLEAELREAARERNEETLVAQKRQEQHDRRVDELNQTVSQLKAELSAIRDSPSSHRRHGSSALERSVEVDSLQSQIESLSDEVVRHRDKLGSAQTEVSALRSRLSAALERAQSAEAALEDAQAAVAAGGRGRDDGDDEGDDVEPGLARMRTRLHRVRQRGRGGVLGRNHTGNSTMRSALKLDRLTYPILGGGGGTAGAEALGKTLDAVDSLLTQTGRVLRANPFARLFLVAYLLLLHVWTFVAIVFHAHGMESLHGDFGADRHPMAVMLTAAAAAQSSHGSPFRPSANVAGAVPVPGAAALAAGEQLVQVSGP